MVQPVQNPLHRSDRDLRALDLKEFLSLVQEDIQELDTLRRHRRQRTVQEDPDCPGLPLFPVTCCGKFLGAFPAVAQVRCPFCGEWHRAGDFSGAHR